MNIRLDNRTENTRSNWPIINDRFTTISNWNIYSNGNIVTCDKGEKYVYCGVVNGARIVRKSDNE